MEAGALLVAELEVAMSQWVLSCAVSVSRSLLRCSAVGRTSRCHVPAAPCRAAHALAS